MYIKHFKVSKIWAYNIVIFPVLSSFLWSVSWLGSLENRGRNKDEFLFREWDPGIRNWGQWMEWKIWENQQKDIWWSWLLWGWLTAPSHRTFWEGSPSPQMGDYLWEEECTKGSIHSPSGLLFTKGSLSKTWIPLTSELCVWAQRQFPQYPALKNPLALLLPPSHCSISREIPGQKVFRWRQTYVEWQMSYAIYCCQRSLNEHCSLAHYLWIC